MITRKNCSYILALCCISETNSSLYREWDILSNFVKHAAKRINMDAHMC